MTMPSNARSAEAAKARTRTRARASRTTGRSAKRPVQRPVVEEADAAAAVEHRELLLGRQDGARHAVMGGEALGTARDPLISEGDRRVSGLPCKKKDLSQGRRSAPTSAARPERPRPCNCTDGHPTGRPQQSLPVSRGVDRVHTRVLESLVSQTDVRHARQSICSRLWAIRTSVSSDAILLAMATKSPTLWCVGTSQALTVCEERLQSLAPCRGRHAPRTHRGDQLGLAGSSALPGGPTGGPRQRRNISDVADMDRYTLVEAPPTQCDGVAVAVVCGRHPGPAIMGLVDFSDHVEAVLEVVPAAVP